MRHSGSWFVVALVVATLGFVGTALPVGAVVGGVTVVGGNGNGSAANQLTVAYGVTVDGSGNVYVADSWNNRVQKWAPGAVSGVTVAGGTQGAGASQLWDPLGIAVDGLGNVYVADSFNNRVQKWAPGAASGVTVAGGNSYGPGANQLFEPTGVVLDVSGNLFVSDGGNDRVQEWAPGAASGVTVAGGNGDGSAANQFSGPEAIARDGSGNLYLADSNNHRIQKWAPGAASGVTVATGDQPAGVAVTAGGTVYVADELNNQITKWVPGGVSDLIVAGGNGRGGGPAKFRTPVSVALDAAGSIYVADQGNYRIQKWGPPTISGVTFTGSAAAPVVTVNGWGFGTQGDLGAPQPTCAEPTTGFNYGSNFYLFDVSQGWAAGQGPPDACDYAGVIITSYSNSRIVFSFDSAYPTYGTLANRDSYTMTVLGLTFSGKVAYPKQPISLTSLTPNQVAVGAKNLVTLDGSGFQAGAKVKVTGPSTGVKASQVTMVDATEMTAVVTAPIGATVGTYTVTITNPDLGKATCTNCLNVIAAPTLTAIDPASVALGSSKVPVTLTGTGFASGAKLGGPAGVTFRQIAVVNASTITAKMTVSASATTGSNLPVTVTNDGSAGNGKVTAGILTLTGG